MVLFAPAVKISDDISPFLQKISGLLGRLVPKLPLVKLDSSGISRIPEVVEKYDNDPLVYRKGCLARTGAEIIKATKRIRSEVESFTLPVLIMHGTADNLSDIEGSKMLYEGVKSADKILKLYDGYYHEIWHDLGKEKVWKDFLDWINAHIRNGD